MTHFAVLDYVLFAAYLLASVLIGVLFVKEQKTVKDYFLAGRSMGSIVVGLSVIAAMFSGISYLAAPAEIYQNGFAFTWALLAFFIATPFTTMVMLPLFYQSRFFTAYQYLEERFSRPVRTLASSLFILRVLLWLAAATYAPALALQQATGMPLAFTILCTGLLTTFYTTLGGMKAVIWTDLMQLAVLFGGQLMIVVVALGKVPGGAAGVYEMAAEAGRLDLSFSLDPTARMTFWAILIGAPFLHLVQLATDQVSVQRYLTARSLGEAKRGLWIKLWLFFPIGGLFYLTGMILWAFYQHQPDPVAAGHIAKADQILPYFVVHELPKGFPGILIAAIYAASMSTVSAGLNSLASTSLMDLRKPAAGGATEDAAQLRRARGLTIGYGLLVTGLAFVIGRMGSLIESVNSIIGLVGGPLLGLFLLGMLVPRANTFGAVTGVLTGFVLLVGLYSVRASWPLSFMWYACYGCVITLAVGTLASLRRQPPAAAQLRGLTWRQPPGSADA